MTLTQINYFLTAAEQGSFSSAAERLFVSQPAVSKQIAMLESELGFQLFSRTDHRVRLTENGQAMYSALRRCTDEIRDIISNIRRNSDSFSGELRIGCVALWKASLFFTPLREYFAEHHAGVRLSLEAYEPPELVEALRRRDVDIALSYDRSFSGKNDLFSTHIKTLECGLLYSLDHFQSRAGEGLQAFDGVPVLVGGGDENVFARMSERVFQAYGLPGKTLPGRRMSSIVMDAFCGRGVMLVTEWNHLVDNSGFGYTPIGREFPVSAAYLRSESAGQKLLLINEAVWTLKNSCE